MGYSSFIKRNIDSLKRNKVKRQLLESISKSEQSNTEVINIHRIDVNNVGDYYCAPHHYFEILKDKALDIYGYKTLDTKKGQDWVNRINRSALIIGGGGLLNRGSFEKQMQLFEHLGKKGKKTVLWGVGHNSKKKKDFNNIKSYNIDIRKFGLSGVRDYSMGHNWVPCVSCMHPIFDQKYDEVHDVGLVYHKKTIKNKGLLNQLSDYPSTSNTTNLKDLVGFIGSCNTIVTDSYHAMYWSMLLKKKVLVIPNSSKFFDFKYQPVITTFEDFKSKLKTPLVYSGLLDECRSINENFAKRVFDYLELN